MLKLKNDNSFRYLAFNLVILLVSCSCMGGKRPAAKVPSSNQFNITSYVAKISGEIMINHLGYTSSYNSITKIPNWVGYELTKKEVEGTVKRDNRFYADPDVPLNIQATFDDYRNDNMWDKGHMAPAGDMKWDERAMKESCYFTNICPQNRNLNNGDWKSLEEKCRDWAQKYGSIHIITGPIIGSMKNGTLGNGNVVIPDAFFKIVVVKIEQSYKGIGFVYLNQAGHKALDSYAMSIDDIEEMTGYNFFPSLIESQEKAIESEYDISIWE